MKGIIYSGKPPSQQFEINQWLDLVEKYLDATRTMYDDNFFTTLDFARILLRRKTAYVGTVRYIKKKPKRPTNSSLFGLNEEDIA